jgi:protein-S-isoprenylcysteine O-methyltransferase Ste14
MGVLWFAWFSMNFNDPVKVTVPTVLRYTGLALFVVGVSLFLFAHRGMGRLKGEDKLVTTGIFSKLRNPMYLGFMVWVVGFPLFMQSMLTLASAILWILHFFFWKVLEEKELAKKFSEYSDYKKKTWF